MRPTPKRIPVATLLILLDKIPNKSCIPPSRINGTRKTRHNRTETEHPKINNKNEHIYPSKMPVQRAHSGN